MASPTRLVKIALLLCLVFAGPAVAGPLHDAARKGDLPEVKRLIDAGADVNAPGALYGWTPLHEAAVAGHVEVARLLINRGAKVDSGAIGNSTPLYWAAAMGQLAVAKLLIDRGANVNARSKSGKTPLHGAVGAKGDTEIGKHQVLVAKLLIANGANVNARDKGGATPLHIAAYVGNYAAVELLLQKGADMGAKDKAGHTGLDWAVRGRQTAVAELLRKHRAEESPYSAAAGKAKAPKHRYDLLGFSVASPAGKVWRVMRATQKVVVFHRPSGRGNKHTIVAWVQVVKGTHAAGDPKEFLRQTIARQVKELKESPRYSNPHVDVTDMRKYGLSCRRSSFTVEDRGVPYAPGKTFILKGWALGCLHPKSPVPLVLVLTASQRYLQGLHPLPLDTELETFLEGVQVTPVPE
jgi:hypothetical protein